jgi:hypothetical protein
MEGTFPWLSKVAQGFEEYEFKGLVFHYVPTSGTAISGTNPALGSVMMQTSYRASGTAPTGKNELLNEYWAGESVPSEPFCHPIECDPKENPFNVKYVRSTDPPVSDSILLYDVGTTYLASSGMNASNPTVGDLWVTYEVVLKKPVVRSNVNATRYSMTYFGSSAIATPFVGVVGTVGSTDVELSGAQMVFPASARGTYRIIITYFSSAATITGGAIGAGTISNLTQTNLIPPLITTTGGVLTNITGGAVTTVTAAFTFRKLSSNVGTWTLEPTLTGTYTGCCVEIMHLD